MRSDMRTILAIDDDVILAAKAIAREQNRSLSEVVSDLARRSLRPIRRRSERNGIPLLGFRADADPVTLDVVNGLRDDLV